MAEIDIGAEVDGTGSFSTGYTCICKDNPANLSGKITKVTFFLLQAVEGLKIGIFEEVDTDKFTTRDYQTLGDFGIGDHVDVSVNLDVVAGDFIGWYVSGGGIDYVDSGHLGIWYLIGDNMPCSEALFTLQANSAPDLYGTGAESAEGTSRGIIIG